MLGPSRELSLREIVDRLPVCVTDGKRHRAYEEFRALEQERNDARTTAEAATETLDAITGFDDADVPCYRLEDGQLQRMPFVMQDRVRKLVAFLAQHRAALKSGGS